MKIPELQLARIRSLNAAKRPPVVELDDLLAAVRSELADVEDIQRDVAAIITPPHWRDSRDVEFARAAAKMDLLFLTRGFGVGDGYQHPRLAGRVNRPGLAELQRLEAKLVTLRERAVEREAQQWPRAFRYTGKPGRTQMEGRYLEPGDVVSLNESQAASFRDRFSEVEQEVTS